MGRKLPMECPAAPEKAFEDFEKERICQTTYHIGYYLFLGVLSGKMTRYLNQGPGIRNNLRFGGGLGELNLRMLKNFET